MDIADTDQVTRVPLHVQIAARLRVDIRQTGKPGAKFGSQNELARRFGVSAITVREAVGALVQEGLLERRHGSGTYVCDTRTAQALGVLIEQDIACPGTSFYWTRMTQQLRRQFEEAGYPTRLYAGHTQSGEPEPERPTCAEFWQDLENDRIRALAIVGTPINEPWQRILHARRIPFISSSQHDVLPNAHQAMIREGTRYLIEHGRRRIAVLTWGTAQHPSSEFQAFKAEMQAHRLPIEAAWVCHAGANPRDSFAGLDGFRQIWQARRETPDGLLICSDRLLQSALSAVRLLNVQVPRALMIVSHTHRGEVSPDMPFPIVRLEVDPDQHARRLGDALLQLVEGQPLQLEPGFRPYRLVEPTETTSPAVAHAPPRAR